MVEDGENKDKLMLRDDGKNKDKLMLRDDGEGYMEESARHDLLVVLILSLSINLLFL